MANDPGQANPDKAAELQLDANERAVADHRARATVGPEPLIIDGTACCRDCEEPIPKARLIVHPGAYRCTSCQADAEARRG